MTQYLFANNVNTTLAASLASGATSMSVTSSANMPTISAGQTFPMTLNDAATGLVFEVVYATARSGAVLTIVRGQEGTTAQTWSAGDFAYNTLTEAEAASFIQTGNEPGGGFVQLSPASTQTGTIKVSGAASAAALLPTAGIAGAFASYLTGGTLTALFGLDLTSGVGDAGIVNAYSGGGFSFYNWNGSAFVKVGAISGSGQISAASDAASTLANVPPVYTQTGASVGAGTHIVTGSNPGVLSGATLVVNLTNAAAFASTDYVVVVTAGGSGGTPACPFLINSATQFTIYNNTGVTTPIFWIAIGV